MAVAADLMLHIRAQAAEFRQGVDAAKNAAKNMSKEISNSMKSAASSLSSSLNQMTGGISGMAQTAAQSFKSIVAGFKGMSGAIAATGIGALIMAITVAIAGLVAAFKRSGEAGDRMAEAMGFLKGVLDFFIGQLVKVGEWLVKAFSDPKTAIKELWEAIKENLVTRFQGVIQLFQGGWEVIKNGAIGVALAIKGIFNKEAKAQAEEYFQAAADGAAKVGEALVMIGTGKTVDEIKKIGQEIVKSGKDGLNVAKLEDALMDQKIKDTTELATMERQLAQTREDLYSEDRKSTESRQRAADLLQKVLTQQDAISARKIAYAKQELALIEAQIAATAGDTSDESRLKIAEARAKVEAEIANASLEKTRYLRQEAMLTAQLAETEKKEQEALYQKELSDANDLAKLNQELTLLRIKDEREVAVKRMEYDKEAALASVASATNAAEQRLAIEQIYGEKLLALKAQFAAEDQKMEAEQAKIAEDNKQKEKELAIAEHEEKIQRINDVASTTMAALDAVSSFQQAAMNKELAAAGDNEAKKDEIRKKYAKKEKQLAVVKAIIGTALAVVNALQTQPIWLGIAMAAVAAAAGAAEIATIKSTPLAKGGLAYGETFATVGEYANARSNPEVIAPLDKLKSMLGNPFREGQVKFVIEQDQLVGILTNANNKQIYF